jgi:hypothetical protein
VKIFHQVTGLFLFVLLTACLPATSDMQTPSTDSVIAEPVDTLVPQAPSAGKYHSLDGRTGIEEIDVILAALESGDPENLRALVSFTSTVCTHAEGLGGPPKCLRAEEEGTTVDVLPFLGGEGSFIRKNEIGDWQGIDASAVYAVYRVSENAYSDEHYPAGEYAILVIESETGFGTSIHVGNGGIVRVDTIFDISADALNSVLERDASEIILSP